MGLEKKKKEKKRKTLKNNIKQEYKKKIKKKIKIKIAKIHIWNMKKYFLKKKNHKISCLEY